MVPISQMGKCGPLHQRLCLHLELKVWGSASSLMGCSLSSHPTNVWVGESLAEVPGTGDCWQQGQDQKLEICTKRAILLRSTKVLIVYIAAG